MLSRRFLLKVLSGLFAFIPAAKVLAASDGSYQVFLPLITTSGSENVRDSLSPPPPPPSWDPNKIIENYVSGTITEFTEQEIIVDSSARGQMILRLSATTALWKGGWNSKYPVKAGDYIDAWGQPQVETNIIDLEKAWINLVNFAGPMNSFTSDGSSARLELVNRIGNTAQVMFDADTEIMLPPDSSPPFHTANVKSVQIADGQIGQVIGLRMDDGSILATRVFLSEPPQPMDTQTSREPAMQSASSKQIQATYYYGHIGFYELCDGANGACKDFGYPCSNSSDHIAYPKLSNTNCDYHCDDSLPWLPCGTIIWVRNDCNASWVYGQIRDCSTISAYGCSHTPRCGGVSQSERTTPLLEVTRGMFIHLGGDLNDGRIPATVYA